MSWLFGYKKPVIPEIPLAGDGGSGGDGAGPSGNDSKGPGGRESVYKFDSTALERAAKAAKDLERSRKTRQIFIEVEVISLIFQRTPIKLSKLSELKRKLNNSKSKNK